MAHKETHRDERQAYDQLRKACLSMGSVQDEDKFVALETDFLKSSQALHKQAEAFKADISKVPFSLLVLLWGKLLSSDTMFGKRYLGMLRDLVDTKLLPLVDGKKPVTLEDVSLQEPTSIIDKIRCHKEWSVQRREDYILLYKAFSDWMSKETFGYVPVAIDFDRLATQKRQVSFETYIEILGRLDLREQILAKIFYLGGHRALEGVLSLKIEDVDFAKSLIRFPEEISFPRHVLEDIKRHTEGREKGFIFMGKDGERISTTTSFRALKKVVSELGLNPEFTFKEFTQNI